MKRNQEINKDEGCFGMNYFIMKKYTNISTRIFHFCNLTQRSFLQFKVGTI